MNTKYVVSDLLEIGTADQQILGFPGKNPETVEEGTYFFPILEDE